MASKPEPIHVNLTADLTEILSAPLTLFGFITLKPGQKKDVPLVDSVVQEFRRAEGIHGVTWGASVQKDDFFVFLAGWESRGECAYFPHACAVVNTLPDMQARDKAVAEGTPCHAIITKIAETANLSRNFVALDKF